MIARPVLPDRAPKVPCGAQDVIARPRGRAILLPEAPVLADGYDGVATTIEDCGVATAGVEGTISGHGADRLIRGELVQQVRQ